MSTEGTAEETTGTNIVKDEQAEKAAAPPTSTAKSAKGANSGRNSIGRPLSAVWFHVNVTEVTTDGQKRYEMQCKYCSHKKCSTSKPATIWRGHILTCTNAPAEVKEILSAETRRSGSKLPIDSEEEWYGDEESDLQNPSKRARRRYDNFDPYGAKRGPRFKKEPWFPDGLEGGVRRKKGEKGRPASLVWSFVNVSEVTTAGQKRFDMQCKYCSYKKFSTTKPATIWRSHLLTCAHAPVNVKEALSAEYQGKKSSARMLLAGDSDDDYEAAKRARRNQIYAKRAGRQAPIRGPVSNAIEGTQMVAEPGLDFPLADVANERKEGEKGVLTLGEIAGDLGFENRCTVFDEEAAEIAEGRLNGIIRGDFRRMFVPCTIKFRGRQIKTIFLVHTSGAKTFVGKPTWDLLMEGSEDAGVETIKATFCGIPFEEIKKSPQDGQFHDVDVLGSDFMKRVNAKLTVDYGSNTCQLEWEMP